MSRRAMNPFRSGRRTVFENAPKQVDLDVMPGCFQGESSRCSSSSESRWVFPSERSSSSKGNLDTAEGDAKLVERALIGDTMARDILVQRLSPLIDACIKRLNVRNRTYLQEEHDFVQEIWARLFWDGGRILKQYDARRGVSLESYCFMVIRREIGNQLRRERAIKRGVNMTIDIEEDDDAPIEQDTPEQYLEARELATRLEQQLQCVLPDIGMDVWRTACRDGAIPSETAEALNVSVQVIYNWLHRIRLLCRDFMETGEPPARRDSEAVQPQ